MKIPAPKLLVLHQFFVKWDSGLDPFHDELLQGPFHFSDTLLAGACPADEFGNHGIVIRRDLVACIHMGIHPDAVAFGGMEGGDGTG